MGYMKSIDTDCLIELNSFAQPTLDKLDEMIELEIKRWEQAETPYDLYKYHLLIEELYELRIELENIFIEHRCIIWFTNKSYSDLVNAECPTGLYEVPTEKYKRVDGL